MKQKKKKNRRGATTTLKTTTTTRTKLITTTSAALNARFDKTLNGLRSEVLFCLLETYFLFSILLREIEVETTCHHRSAVRALCVGSRVWHEEVR